MDQERTPAQEVGAGLKSARISRGYALESVCQHTRIPRKYLEALEAGRFDDLPAPVYLRSFLGSYCEYLELDIRPLWDKLHPPPAVAAAAVPPTTPSQPARPAPAPSAQGKQAKAQSAQVARPLGASPYFNALVSSLGAVALSLALALALVWWTARGSKAGPPSNEDQRPLALQPLRPAVEPKLGLVCRDEAWVSVKSDGVVLFAGRVPKGARQEFQAHKVILLRAAASNNLDITLNGAPYRLPRPDENGEYRLGAP